MEALCSIRMLLLASQDFVQSGYSNLEQTCAVLPGFSFINYRGPRFYFMSEPATNELIFIARYGITMFRTIHKYQPEELRTHEGPSVQPTGDGRRNGGMFIMI